MTFPARIPGKYGRLPAQLPAGLGYLASYAAGPLPKPPASVAVPSVAGWDALGNLTYGDCGVAGLEHLLEAAAADTGETETFPTADQCVAYYLDYTGGVDGGVVLSAFLAHVKASGYYGHTVAAYAPVAIGDIPTLQFAVWAYDGAYCGITVTQAMEQAWQAGQPWTPDLLDSPVAGGHCVPVVGYDADYLYCVTWGSVQPITYSAWHYIAEEAWAVITGEITAKGDDGHGISVAALQADLDQLDGRPPAPPAPKPPAPDPLLAELATRVRASAGDLLAFLSSHGL